MPPKPQKRAAKDEDSSSGSEEEKKVTKGTQKKTTKVAAKTSKQQPKTKSKKVDKTPDEKSPDEKSPDEKESSVSDTDAADDAGGKEEKNWNDMSDDNVNNFDDDKVETEPVQELNNADDKKQKFATNKVPRAKSIIDFDYAVYNSDMVGDKSVDDFNSKDLVKILIVRAHKDGHFQLCRTLKDVLMAMNFERNFPVDKQSAPAQSNKSRGGKSYSGNFSDKYNDRQGGGDKYNDGQNSRGGHNGGNSGDKFNDRQNTSFRGNSRYSAGNPRAQYGNKDF